MIQTQSIIKKLKNQIDLTANESDYLANYIINGKFDSNQIASFLTFLYIKGESYQEIYSFISLLKKKMKKLKLGEDVMDTCGTGGDHKNSFNFSTATSICLSACNIKIAKHGNRSITSKSGSFDVLEKLGIKIDLDLTQTKKFFKKNGICFLFAPRYHPILKNYSEVRKSLTFKTIFNLLGPLLNPVSLKYQLLGVSEENNLTTHAKCLAKFNIKKAWVVHNENGYDELTTTSKNLIIEIKKGVVKKKKILDPREFGFKQCKEEDLRGGSAEENAFMMRRVFDGETGPIRDNLILNSAAGLLISEKVKTLAEGIDLIQNKINNGVISEKLIALTEN